VHEEPASLDEGEGVEDPQEAVDGDVVGTGQREVGRTLAEIDSPREVVAPHAKAGRASVAPHDDIFRERHASRRRADLNAPVGGPCREKPLISVTDDGGDVRVPSDNRGTETRDPDAQLNHGRIIAQGQRPEKAKGYGLTAKATRDGPQYHRRTSATNRAKVTKADFATRKGQPFGWSAFPHQSFTPRNPALSSVMASVLGGKFMRCVPI